MNLNNNKTLSEGIFLRPWPVTYLVFSIYTYVCGYEYTYMCQFLVIFPHFKCGKGSDISGDCNCQNIPQHSRVHRLGLEFAPESDWYLVQFLQNRTEHNQIRFWQNILATKGKLQIKENTKGLSRLCQSLTKENYNGEILFECQTIWLIFVFVFIEFYLVGICHSHIGYSQACHLNVAMPHFVFGTEEAAKFENLKAWMESVSSDQYQRSNRLGGCIHLDSSAQCTPRIKLCRAPSMGLLWHKCTAKPFKTAK